MECGLSKRAWPSSIKNRRGMDLGFFTDDEIGSLHITNMILHVVGGEEFIPEAARAVEHEEFFIARICDTDASPV